MSNNITIFVSNVKLRDFSKYYLLTTQARKRLNYPCTSSASCFFFHNHDGVGSFESSPTVRLQLALAALLRRNLHLEAALLELFDLVLSVVECATAAVLDFSVPSLDNWCCRRVEPTLFHMPHCEASF